ncbi:MAG: hypothetical protein ACLSGS_04550 [Adlercreutzia sp.]
MDFAIILAVTIVGCFALRNPLKALPVAFYAAAIAIDVVYVYGVFFGLPRAIWRPLFVLIQKCELSLALFVVVMFIGCLNRGGRAYHWLKPVRSELSIVAWFLSLGHMAVYLESYLPRLLGGGEIGGNVMGAFVLAVVLLVLLVVLGVTSFAFVKRQMSTASWKKVQKLAYPFFGLVYVHLLHAFALVSMAAPPPGLGGVYRWCSSAMPSAGGRALSTGAEDAVSASNDLTPAISDEPMVCRPIGSSGARRRRRSLR